MANFSIADGGAELDDEFGRGGQDELDGLVRGGGVAEIDGEFVDLVPCECIILYLYFW